MKELLIVIIALSAIVTSCSESSSEDSTQINSDVHHDAHHDVHHDHHEMFEMNPTYTFMSISTAKPGKLDDLVRITSEPSELMDEHLDGLIARQVSVDTARNSVVVWVAFDNKETLYNHLETEQGKQEHGDQAEMDSIIETFTMYDLSPQSQRLIPKH